ncbi:MAG TPA: type II toxin-antitoxin system VapC family toxin [Polyangiaceae bacterium]|jgi:predicted nucleic acid-binding protein|nr:type II toxin-antitoxin system VapC family toxin [Polyangiaceae bacterium]
MRFVLDASVAVAAQRPNDPHFQAARARVMRFLTGEDSALVPSLFVVETSGALARLGFERAKIVRIVDALTAYPHKVVTVGPRSARAARAIAIQAKLPGAGALYVWLARRSGAALCTLDQEMAARGAAFCEVSAP